MDRVWAIDGVTNDVIFKRYSPVRLAEARTRLWEVADYQGGEHITFSKESSLGMLFSVW